MNRKELKARIASCEQLINEAIFCQDAETVYHYTKVVEGLKKDLAASKPVYPEHLYVRLGDLVNLEAYYV